MQDASSTTRTRFTHPTRQIVLMIMVLVLSGAVSVLALPRIMSVFEANPYLNGTIVLVFLIGVCACFWQVWQLVTSVRWIESYISDTRDTSLDQAPLLLAPLVSLLREADESMQISSFSARSILDSVAQRIDEAREITRYIVNLLIFLGLLGTFYGLATTVPAVVDTIRSLAPQEGDSGVEVFNRLMSGLESQLGGMGVAFASSLLGLAGSLIVGLLELFAGHGQNRFYRELEELLSSVTKFSFGLGDGASADNRDDALRVLNYMAEQTEALNLTITQSDVGRAELEERLSALTDTIGTLCDHLRHSAEQDPESRMRLRSIDAQMQMMVKEMRDFREGSTVPDRR